MADTDGLIEPESLSRLSYENKSGTESLCAVIALIVALSQCDLKGINMTRTVHRTLFSLQINVC